MLPKFSKSGVFTSYYDGSWGYVSYPNLTISSRGWNKTTEYRWREESWRSLEQRPLRWIATRRDAKFESNIKESEICLCGQLSRKSSSAVGGKLKSKERVGLPWWLSGKESTCQCRRCGFDPWVGKIPGEGNGNPLKYSCPGNPMDRGAWWAIVQMVANRAGHDLVTKQQPRKNIHLYPLLQVNSTIAWWLLSWSGYFTATWISSEWSRLLTNGLQVQFRLHLRFHGSFTSFPTLIFLLIHPFHSCGLQESLQISLLHANLAAFPGSLLLEPPAQGLNFTAGPTIILWKGEAELKGVPYLLKNMKYN